MPSAFVQWMQQHQRPISYVDDTDRLGQARQRLGIKVAMPPVEPAPVPQLQAPPPLDGMVMNGQDVGRYRDVPFADIFQEAGTKYGVDPALLMAMGKQESGFNPTAQSGAGAVGIMQLMEPSARQVGVTDRTDPYQSIMGGARYARWLYDTLENKGYGTNNTEAMLRSWNGGIGNFLNGVYPSETQRFVPAVQGFYQQYR